MVAELIGTEREPLEGIRVAAPPGRVYMLRARAMCQNTIRPVRRRKQKQNVSEVTSRGAPPRRGGSEPPAAST